MHPYNSSILLSYFHILGVDECALDIDSCDANAACINLGDGFRCICNVGYSGDGLTCEGNIVFFFCMISIIIM